MKISLSTKQFFDLDGTPLSAGRVSVRHHDTDIAVDLYEYTGNGYVQAANPFQLDNAGMNPGIWFEAESVDVLVERYNGLDGSYSQVDTFTDGFTMPDVRNDTIVYGISGLEQANPELGSVSVVGFNGPSDCGPRTFIWDPLANDADDGCCIVRSDSEPGDGRWILVSDCKYMPSQYFGVAPGSESNIASFLSYPATAGQWNIPMPSVPRFLPGTYNSAGNVTTNKVISFASGAKFTKMTFTLPSVEVDSRADYVADFVFTGKDTSAHSSWFRTADGFWHCDARYLYIDSAEYMTDKKLYTSTTLDKCTIVADGHIATTYATGTYVKLNDVNVVGKPFAMGSDYIILSTTAYGDRIFSGSAWDPGLISAGHHVQFSMQPSLDRFDSAKLWYLAMKERRGRLPALTDDFLDFQGREMTDAIFMGTFSKLMNVTAPSVNISGISCVLENVNADVYVSADTSTTLLVNDSVIQLYSFDGLVSLGGNDSTITVVGVTGIDPSECTITWNGGKWYGKIWLPDAKADTYAKGNTASFNRVDFPQMTPWRMNSLAMRSCFGSVKVDLLPYVSGSDYLYDIVLIDNIFTGDTRFWLTMYGTVSSPHTEVAGHAKFGAFIVTGNQWRGSDVHPLKMLRWHPYGFNTFLASDVGSWEYTGNIGNCPLVKPPSVNNSVASWGTAETGPDSYKVHLLPYAQYMFCPYFNMTSGGIDYMHGCERDGALVRMGDWIGSFPSYGGSHNYHVFGMLKMGQVPPADYWDEDGNNTFIVYAGVSIGIAAIGDLTEGVTNWPEN